MYNPSVLKSHDGKVFYREWTCLNPRAVVILVHGLGGYSGRFFEFAPVLLKAGLKVYAIELKGFGETSAIRGHISNFSIYTDELKSLIKYAEGSNPGKKIFLLGESMGGLISLDLSIHHQDLIDGLILISPAIKDKLPIGITKKAKIFLSLLTDPKKLFGSEFSASMFTRDRAMAKRIDSDPLEVRKMTATFFWSILKALMFVNANAKRIEVPALMLLAGQDKMVSTEAAKDYFKKLSSKDKTLEVYPDMYHALYVDLGREKVFNDIIEWINGHC